MSESCCPRCGGAFECGAMGPGPCACQSVSPRPELQARLRQQFSGCLCLGCLRALSAGVESLHSSGQDEPAFDVKLDIPNDGPNR